MGTRDSREILASHFLENLSDESEVMDQELRDYVASVVDALPEDYRDIVEAILYERLTYREAADKLGYKAHSHLYYKFEQALEMMRKDLEGVI